MSWLDEIRISNTDIILTKVQRDNITKFATAEFMRLANNTNFGYFISYIVQCKANEIYENNQHYKELYADNPRWYAEYYCSDYDNIGACVDYLVDEQFPNEHYKYLQTHKKAPWCHQGTQAYICDFEFSDSETEMNTFPTYKFPPIFSYDSSVDYQDLYRESLIY